MIKRRSADNKRIIPLKSDNIISCEICGQDTSFERHTKDLPNEGERATCCDAWVCVDCICWVETDEVQCLCKDCCKCYISEQGTHWRVGGERHH